MELKRSHKLVFGLLAGVWLLVVAWQVKEHLLVAGAAEQNLRSRSHEITRTLGAMTRAMGYRGAVFQRPLKLVLDEMVNSPTNALVSSSGLLAVGMFNTAGDPLFALGATNLFPTDVLAEGEHWTDQYVTFVLPVVGDLAVEGAGPESVTNSRPTVVLPTPTLQELTNNAARDRDFSRRHGPPPDESGPVNTNFPPPPTNEAGVPLPPPDQDRRPPDGGGGGGGDRSRGGSHRPPWLRGMSDGEFKAFISKHELHGLVLVMSTENYRAVVTDDWWLRWVIAFFAGISAVGAGLAWRNIGKTAELQIRLVRASELNSHLKELNLAAAGLAHETRNPLNIIRGLAQMVSRLPDASPEVRAQSKTIIEETDKVTAQLTEFINYSRPREVRPARIALAAAVGEIVRTLGQDIAEKRLRVETTGNSPVIEADEQLLRQVLFNLLLNAIQAADAAGHIEVFLHGEANGTATMEIRDNGPGVPPERRLEIFKPYFTTHQKGTGLGLAVVQQIVLAHGWEIQCLGNPPRGAIFRITHIKLAA